MSLVQSDTAMKLEMKLSVLLYEQTVTNDEIKCVDEIKSCKCTCLKIDIVLFKNLILIIKKKIENEWIILIVIIWIEIIRKWECVQN